MSLNTKPTARVATKSDKHKWFWFFGLYFGSLMVFALVMFVLRHLIHLLP